MGTDIEKVNGYSENLLKANEIILNDAISKVKFDKTEICEIVSKDQNDETCYWVTNNNGLKYQAYSSVSYSTGTKVYVLIPQNDYNMRKIITDKYDDNTKEQYNLLIKPFDNFVVRNEIDFGPNPLTITVDNIAIQVASKYQENEFYDSKFGQFDYLGLEFTVTTGFGGTEGEFCLEIALNGTTSTFSSKQILGNPYYLTDQIVIQHLFYWPEGIKASDINNITVSLYNVNNFSEPDSTITINSLKLYFGYDITNNNLKQDNIKISLVNSDRTLKDTTTPSSFEYTNNTDIKNIQLEWYDEDNKRIYNYTNTMDNNDYTIYWLQYALFDGYQKNNTSDIAESGAYWKTIQSYDSDDQGSYLYTLTPTINWSSEDIKVGIRKQVNGNIFYEESNTLHFINTIYKVAPAELEKIKDSLTFTLDDNDDGIYNEYGIDNKLIKKNQVHSITAYFTNDLVWNANLQNTIWKIPKNSSMLIIPKIYDSTTHKYINDPDWIDGDDPRWPDNTRPAWIPEGEEINYYINISGNQTISYGLNEQFNFSRTNNNIECKVFRYQDGASKTENINKNIFQGSFKFQFGTQGTSGTGYAFNIYPDTPDGLLTNNSNSIIFTAKLENELGQKILFNETNIEWSFLYESKQSLEPYLTYEINNNTVTITGLKSNIELSDLEGDFYFPYSINSYIITDIDEIIDLSEASNLTTLYMPYYNASSPCFDFSSKISGVLIGNYYIKYGSNIEIDYNDLPNSYQNYSILIATLNGFIDEKTNKPVVLKAYYPIPITSVQNYYISGANQIIYDYQGTNPNYDNEIYKLYDRSNNEEINVDDWVIEHFENDNSDNYPNLKNVKQQNIILGQAISPLSNMNTINKPCRVVAYDNEDNELYSLPILILQNTYAFSLLNTWNGSTYVGENEIMSQLIGAGTKNSNNQYTGILMGAISNAGAAATTGLYGFQDGALRYKLDEYGSFYVGTGGDNYISFNEGNDRSSNDEMVIKTNDFILNTNNIVIDSTEPIIKVNSNETNYPTKIKIGKLYNSIYGLDAYKGSLWLFPCAASEVENKDEPQRKQIASLYFDNNKMYIKGEITTEKNTNSKISLGIKSANLIYGSSFDTTEDAILQFYKKNGAEETSYLSFGSRYNGSFHEASLSFTYPAQTQGCLYINSGSSSGDASGSQLIITCANNYNTLAVKSYARLSLEGNGRIRLENSNSNQSITLKADNRIFLQSFNGKRQFIIGETDTGGAMEIISSTVKDNSTGGFRIRTDEGGMTTIYAKGGGQEEYWEHNGDHRGIITFWHGFWDGVWHDGGHLHGDWSIFDNLYFQYGGANLRISCESMTQNNTTTIEPMITSIENNRSLNLGVGSNVCLKCTKSGNTIGGHLQGYWTVSSVLNCIEGINIGNSNYSLYKATNDRTVVKGNSGVILATGSDTKLETNSGGGRLWDNWYIDSGAAVTSDVNKKHSIAYLSNNYENLFNNLHPVIYKYNDGTSNRYHIGFISQDVEQAIISSNLTTQDFAGFVKDKDNNYYLRYDEFVALNTWQIQKLKTRVAELEKEIKEIKNEIN